MAVPDVFRVVLGGSSLSPGTQRVVFDAANKAGDVETLVALCELDSLDDHVDADLGGVGDAKVRASWLARPNRDPNQVLDAIRRERRQTVLASAAAVPGLTVEAYELLLARCKGRGSLVAFVCGPAPENLRAVAAKKLFAAGFTIGHSDEAALLSEASRSPAITAAALSATSCYEWIDKLCCAGTGMLDECVALSSNVCYTLVAAFTNSGQSPHRAQYSLNRVAGAAAAAFMRVPLSTQQWDQIRAAASARMESLGTVGGPALSRRSVDVLDELSAYAAAAGDVEAAFYEGRYSDALAKLSGLVANGHRRARVLVENMISRVCRRDLPTEVLWALAAYSVNPDATVVGSVLPATDPDDTGRLAVLASLATSLSTKREVLSAASDVDAVFAVCISPRKATEGMTNHMRARLTSLMRGVYDPEVLLHAPGSFLAASAGTVHVPLSPDAAADLINVVIDRIGVDSDRWELLLEMCPDSDVQLEELTELVTLSLPSGQAVSAM